MKITVEINHIQPRKFALLTDKITNVLYNSSEIPTHKLFPNFPTLGIGTLHNNFKSKYTRPHVGMQVLRK